MSEVTVKTNGWERRSVTFNLPANCSVRLITGLNGTSYGTVWYDDLQLEKGDGVSSYNLIENSAFTNGTANWLSQSVTQPTVTWAGLTGFDNCSKLVGSPADAHKNIWQYIPVSGKKGDVFSFGMWAWANSAPLNDLKKSDPYKPYFELTLDYYDPNGKWLGVERKPFNPDVKDSWQFLTNKFVLPADCGKIAVSLIYDHNVNAAYMTGAFCYKEEYGQTYTYDKNGNLVSAVDLAKTNSTFSYYGNQMSKMLNPSGSKYLYNYNDKKQLTYALSSDGQEYGFTYDGNGNVTKAEITSRKPATAVESGKEYILVNSYSGLAMDSYWKGNEGDKVTTYRYTPTSKCHRWKFTRVSRKQTSIP